MRLLATTLCLGLVACTSSRLPSVEEPMPSPLPGLALVVPDSPHPLLGLDRAPYRALLDSLGTWRPDSSRASYLIAPHGLRLPDSSVPNARLRTLTPAPSGRCDQAIPMPRVASPDSIPPVPMPQIQSDGPPPVPMPNLCGPAQR